MSTSFPIHTRCILYKTEPVIFAMSIQCAQFGNVFSLSLSLSPSTVCHCGLVVRVSDIECVRI